MRTIYFLLPLLLLANYCVQAQGTRPVTTTNNQPLPIPVIPDSVTGNTTQLSNYLLTHTQEPVAFTRALYNWMANTIAYDVINTYKPDYYKDTADAVTKTLQTRVAVCQGYAALFSEVCRKGGIPAYFIGGYTQLNGQLGNASHAWVGVKFGDKWYMMDPTWGAGYLQAGKFVRKLNWSYFMVKPEVFVKTHISFDPLWQLSTHPVRHDEFRDSNWSEAGKRPAFSLTDSLDAYSRQSLMAQMQHKIARIESFGVTNQLIGNELVHARNMIQVTQYNDQVARQNKEVSTQNVVIDKYNKGGSLFNEGVGLFNKFVEFKNAQFRPGKPDNEIKAMVDEVGTRLTLAREELDGLQTPDKNIQQQINTLKKSVADLQKRVEEEELFVQKYIKTGKLFRKTLFYKFGA